MAFPYEALPSDTALNSLESRLDVVPVAQELIVVLPVALVLMAFQ